MALCKIETKHKLRGSENLSGAGWVHHERFPRPLAHHDPWLQDISDL